MGICLGIGGDRHLGCWGRCRGPAGSRVRRHMGQRMFSSIKELRVWIAAEKVVLEIDSNGTVCVHHAGCTRPESNAFLIGFRATRSFFGHLVIFW